MKLTKDQFWEAASKTRLYDRGRTAAKLILVDGKNSTEAAQEVGFSPAAARQAKARVLREFRKMESER